MVSFKNLSKSFQERFHLTLHETCMEDYQKSYWKVQVMERESLLNGFEKEFYKFPARLKYSIFSKVFMKSYKRFQKASKKDST